MGRQDLGLPYLDWLGRDLGQERYRQNVQPSTVLSWCQSPLTPAGRADLQFDEVRQLRALRQIPAVPRVPAGRGRGTPPAGTWILTPREPGHCEEGADRGGKRRGEGCEQSHEGSSPDLDTFVGLGRCSAPESSLYPQKPKLKPGKSLPLGVEELGQLPLAEGRPLRKSFRRGEIRTWS